MKKIGLFYGSTLGATEERAEEIAKQIDADVYNIDSASLEDFDKYDTIILAASTWGYGDLQLDWSSFLDMNGIPNLKDKKVAIFGLGDQDSHHDVFVNAIGLLHDMAKESGASLYGYWPLEGYAYGPNTTAVRDGHFLGLPLDDVNQAALSSDRITKWVEQLKKEML